MEVCVIGLTRILGLGDAAQYYIAAMLINKVVPQAKTTLLCPYCRLDKEVIKDLRIDFRISEWKPVPLLSALLMSVKDHYTRCGWNKSISMNDSHSRHSIMRGSFIKVLTCTKTFRAIDCVFGHLSSQILLNTTNKQGFDCGIIGGHTVFCGCAWSYRLARRLVKGPLVIGPISLPRLLHRWDLWAVKKYLMKMDHIYVRGFYSYSILKELIGVKDERMDVALDTGFGIVLIPELILSLNKVQKQKYKRDCEIRVTILPRPSHFDVYGKGAEALRSKYLATLAKAVAKLIESYDCEIVVTSQIVKNGRDIKEFLETLEGKISRSFKKRIRIVKVRSLVDACALYSSSDLVISSYMHGGIFALALGVPAIFVMPREEVKVLDILSFLQLDADIFLLDMFNVKDLGRITDVTFKVLDDLSSWRQAVKNAVLKRLPSIYEPIKRLCCH